MLCTSAIIKAKVKRNKVKVEMQKWKGTEKMQKCLEFKDQCSKLGKKVYSFRL